LEISATHIHGGSLAVAIQEHLNDFQTWSLDSSPSEPITNSLCNVDQTKTVIISYLLEQAFVQSSVYARDIILDTSIKAETV